VYLVRRHHATGREVWGYIPDVTGFFKWMYPSSRRASVGSTQILTEKGNRILPGDIRRPARKVDILIAISEPTVKKGSGTGGGEAQRFRTLYGPSLPITGIALPFYMLRGIIIQAVSSSSKY
jgi:hypothetical protein